MILYDSPSNYSFVFNFHVSFNSKLHIRSRRVFFFFGTECPYAAVADVARGTLVSI